MQVALPPEQEAIVRRLLKSGRYDSESEVIAAALELLDDDARAFEEVRRKVREGLDQAERGEVEPFDETTVERVKSDGRKRLEKRRHRAAQ